MNKFFFTFIFVLSATFIFCQEKYDVRKTRWGMTKKEVMASEAPLVPETIYDVFTKVEQGIEYKNVSLGNRYFATIYYGFSNGKLDNVIYAVFSPYSVNCENPEPLYGKISSTKFIFDALSAKGLKCSHGWGFSNSFLIWESGFDNCNIDKETVEKIDLLAKKNRQVEVYLSLKGERTNAFITFNEFQNGNVNNLLSLFPCTHEYYNKYFKIDFSPTPELEVEIRKNDF